MFLALAGGGLLRTQLQPCALDGRLEGHTDDVNCVEVWRGLVVSGSDDRTVRVWKADGSGQEACIATLEGHTARIWYTLTTDDYIYSASADNTVCVWDAHAATVGVAALVTRLEGHSDTVFALAVAAGFIYSGSADKCIKQWSSSSHTLCQSWQAHDVSRKIRPYKLLFDPLVVLPCGMFPLRIYPSCAGGHHLLSIRRQSPTAMLWCGRRPGRTMEDY